MHYLLFRDHGSIKNGSNILRLFSYFLNITNLPKTIILQLMLGEMLSRWNDETHERIPCKSVLFVPECVT